MRGRWLRPRDEHADTGVMTPRGRQFQAGDRSRTVPA